VSDSLRINVLGDNLVCPTLKGVVEQMVALMAHGRWTGAHMGRHAASRLKLGLYRRPRCGQFIDIRADFRETVQLFLTDTFRQIESLLIAVVLRQHQFHIKGGKNLLGGVRIGDFLLVMLRSLVVQQSSNYSTGRTVYDGDLALAGIDLLAHQLLCQKTS